jgi:hypothetical protein
MVQYRRERAANVCPHRDSTIAYVSEAMPDVMAITIGAFSGPHCPPTTTSGYGERRHHRAVIRGDDVEHFD